LPFTVQNKNAAVGHQKVPAVLQAGCLVANEFANQ